ncbi:MAG TPA: TetR/AcrR family transcriptional regulator [Ktedonobacteraceae bacterium]|nr:TetR/AcrR family transcriptional regulator [Ktedonobacteraceae bacterium]
MSEVKRKRGEQTREAILAAAEAEFADHGFDGTRVDAIAERSGFNKTLIFRYFGEKLGLYTAVLRRADQELHALHAHLFSPLVAQQPAAALATAIGVIFDYLVDHPRFLRILTWEMAAGWQTAARLITESDREEISHLGSALQYPRWLRSPFAPAIQLTLLMQVCHSYLAFLPLYQVLFPNEDVSSPGMLAYAREYLTAFLIRGLTDDGTPDGKPLERNDHHATEHAQPSE